MYKNIIFDFDGVIVNSADGIIDSLRCAYKEADITKEKILMEISNNLIGPVLSEIVDTISPSVTKEEKEKIIYFFRKFYDNYGFNNCKLYPKIVETLSYLKEHNYKLFIATNKPNCVTKKIIKKFSLNVFFIEIVCSDHLKPPLTKENMINKIIENNFLLRNETVMVGDSLSDLIAAKNEKIASIAVLSGYGDRGSLLSFAPNNYLEQTYNLKDFFIKQ